MGIVQSFWHQLVCLCIQVGTLRRALQIKAAELSKQAGADIQSRLLYAVAKVHSHARHHPRLLSISSCEFSAMHVPWAFTPEHLKSCLCSLPQVAGGASSGHPCMLVAVCIHVACHGADACPGDSKAQGSQALKPVIVAQHAQLTCLYVRIMPACGTG